MSRSRYWWVPKRIARDNSLRPYNYYYTICPSGGRQLHAWASTYTGTPSFGPRPLSYRCKIMKRVRFVWTLSIMALWYACPVFAGLQERINVCLFSLSMADFLVVMLHFAWGLDWTMTSVIRDPESLPVLRFFVNNHIIGLYACKQQLRHRLVCMSAATTS